MLQKYKNYIKTQAENFEKLKWRQKNKNFVLFFSLCSIIVWTIIFGLDTALEEITVENKSKYINNALWLAVMIPAQYLAYKNYVSGMIVILLVSLLDKTFIFSVLMIMPIQIELCRRKYKARENKNVFKDIIISLGLGCLILLIASLKIL